MARTDCPKCQSASAWFEADNTDLTLRCMCGYRRVVYSTLEEISIQRNTPRDSIRLPKAGTHLSKTLRCLKAIGTSNSAEITQALVDMGNSFTVSSVSSYLTILRSMGLVETAQSKRGIPGGSTWNLTVAASKLLGE